MLNAIEHVNAETVFILPNNKNIILAATQAQSLVEDKNVVIIPTTTVPQGISAIIGFDPEADAEENEDNMKAVSYTHLRWIIFNLHFFKFRLYSCRNFG